MNLPITYAEDEPAGEVPAPGATMTLELREAALLARNALEKIANGTPDDAPPYRAMMAPQMQAVARAALSHLASGTSEGVSGSDVPAPCLR